MKALEIFTLIVPVSTTDDTNKVVEKQIEQFVEEGWAWRLAAVHVAAEDTEAFSRLVYVFELGDE